MYNKAHVARSFSKAASTYDKVAILQEWAGNTLIDVLMNFNVYPKNIIDLGSGTGKLTYKLTKLFPESNYISIDIAYGMLQFARDTYSKGDYIAADADYLPFPGNYCDLIFSNLM